MAQTKLRSQHVVFTFADDVAYSGVRHQDLDDAYQARTPISYLGPIDDPEFPGVAHSGEIEALVILIQENKSLAGEVMMYTYILDLVRPLKFEREGDTSG